MTRLRQRMLEDMQLRGLSARTQGSYITAVRQVAEHYHRSPDQLTEEELRQYFLYLANEKKVARTTATIALCGIRFFVEQTLGRSWTTLRFVRPAPEKKLPVVLRRDEVRRVLQAIRLPVYRMCLTTIYSCGLRLLEGAHLQVTPAAPRPSAPPVCPLCHIGTLTLIAVLRPLRKVPP
jgi:integrase/recombinase XerD